MKSSILRHLAFCVILLPALAPLRAQLYINEFLASNINSVAEPDGDLIQWIEIYNAGYTAVYLNGYYLSDDPEDPFKCQMTDSLRVPGRGYAIVWLERERNEYRCDFSLDMDGEEIALYSPQKELLDRVEFGPQKVDISYGRVSDGDVNWAWFPDPTPSASNNTDFFRDSLTAPGVSFSTEGGLFQAPLEVIMSTSAPGGVIKYTTDGSWPHPESSTYTGPVIVGENTVLKARVYQEGYLPGPVNAQTYIFNEDTPLPVVSLSTDPDYFFSGDLGIYVKGYKGMTGYCSEEKVNWNRDWERPVNIEYYNADKEQVINQVVGVKICGGCSRAYPLKSMALIARKRYGDNRMNYRFFNTKEADSFKQLQLRNSGNDVESTMFRDGFMQTLIMGEVAGDFQGYQPKIVYVNGEYWGIMNLRERINEHYPASNFSMDSDDIDMLEKEDIFKWDAAFHGSGDHYVEMMEYIRSHDLALEENFRQVATMMDVEEFLNYYLADIYFQNEDWPQNNIKYWRPHREGGKWRWILYDTDFGWGNLPKTGNSLLWATRGATADELIRSLLENARFKNEFIQRLASMTNTIFHPDRVGTIFDSLLAMVEPEMERHISRWGMPYRPSYDWDVGYTMPRFTQTRPDSIRLFTMWRFGISGLYDLEASVSDPAHGKIRAAGIDLPPDFTGKYFRNIPLRLTAIPASGYAFSHWEGIGSSYPEVYLNTTEAKQVRAVFRVSIPQDDLYINEISAITSGEADEYGQFDDWIEIYNGSGEAVDLAGFYLGDTLDFEGMYRIPDSYPVQTIIMPGEYKLIWCDGESAQGPLHTDFRLNASGESVYLAGRSGEDYYIADSVYFGKQFAGTSYGRDPEVASWDHMISTPGAVNRMSPKTPLVINEYSTNNEGVFRDEHGEADDWIEIYNPTDSVIDCGGLFLTDSLGDPLKYRVPEGDASTRIPPGGHLVFWADDQVEQGACHLDFRLDGESEQIGLYQLGAGYLDSLTYFKEHRGAILGRIPDGSGEFVLLSPTPGRENLQEPAGVLFLNEYMAANGSTIKDEHGDWDDWIEIFNPGDTDVDIGGLYLTDSLDHPTLYRIPAGQPDSTTVPAGGYLLLWADGEPEEGILHLGFRLSAAGEEVGLTGVDGREFIDSLSFGTIESDQAYGRMDDGQDHIQRVSSTPGSTNLIKPVQGIFINEFMASNRSTLADERGEYDDWIEIYNASEIPVDIGGLYLTDSLPHPHKYRIPSHCPDSTTIEPGGHMLLWADGQDEQGILHLPFGLRSDGESIGVAMEDGLTFIDALSFTDVESDQALGRLEDGQPEIRLLSATPGTTNSIHMVANIRINEIMASNRSTLADEHGEYDDWIEIYNANDFPVDIGGLYFTDSLNSVEKFRMPSYSPDSTTIPEKGYLILWADGQDYQGIRHLDFKLGGSGEFIGLYQPDARTCLDSFTYSAVLPDQALGLLPDGQNPMQTVNASPGRANYLNPLGNLVISELMTSGNSSLADGYGEYDDWIEIYNGSDFPVDLGGLFMTDSLGDLPKWRIPEGYPEQTIIDAGEYLILWADGQPEQGALHMGFRLSGKGEAIAITGIDGTTIIDSLSYPDQYTGFSYNRTDNKGAWIFQPPTPMVLNVIEPIKGIKINEFMSSNSSYPDDFGEFDDWIELKNESDRPLDLGGMYLSDSIGNDKPYRIPSNAPELTTLDPGGYFVVFADNQSEQGVQHANFKLSRDGEQILLLHYDSEYIIDSLTYTKQFRNAALGRLEGNQGWFALPATPGSDNRIPDYSGLKINEIMGDNRTVIPDEHGEYDDWIELYNGGNDIINVGGLYLSDSLDDFFQNRITTEYPDSTTLAPGDYLLLWMDGDEEQGVLHMGLKLSKSGEWLGLYGFTSEIIDSVYLPFISPNHSWGRHKDGQPLWKDFGTPTPGEANNDLKTSRDNSDLSGGVRVYPNPVTTSATFEINLDHYGSVRLEICDVRGSRLSIREYYPCPSGKLQIHWEPESADGVRLAPGLYFYRIHTSGKSFGGKIMVE